MLVVTMSKIRDHLTSTERVLWQGKPEPKALSKAGANLVPIIIGAIMLISSLAYIVPTSLLQGIQTIDFTIFFIPLVGLFVLGIGAWTSYTAFEDSEYLITNQRVIICSNKHVETPKIINLYEVNGQITMTYNKPQNTGSIYIPTPHWNRFVDSGHAPDIKNVREPHIVYDILMEALEIGRRTKWKQDNGFFF